MCTVLANVALMALLAILPITAACARGNGVHKTHAYSDTAAIVVEPSPPAASVTLTGTLQHAALTSSEGVFVHARLERGQQYFFLHLDKPIDVLKVVDNDHRAVFHQYDIQVVGPSHKLDPMVSYCVTITGIMPAPGGIEGGPDWQPFPLTMSSLKDIRRVDTCDAHYRSRVESSK